MKNEANERVKPLLLTDNETGDKYTLEYSRESVVFTNKQGFKVSEVDDNPEEMIPILFYGSFRKNHKNISRQKTDKILFEDLQGLSPAALERLIMLYGEPRKTLINNTAENGGEPKNEKMTLEL